MQEPFDLRINGIDYAVFPENDGIYAIYKDGKEHVQIQKDTGSIWIKFDPQTEVPVFEIDPEVDALGAAIDAYLGEEEEE